MKPILSPLLAAGMVLMVAPCHSYQPLQAPPTAAAQTVRVQFSQPRELVGTRAGGGDSVLAAGYR